MKVLDKALGLMVIVIVLGVGAMAADDPLATARKALDAGEPKDAVAALQAAAATKPADLDLKAELALAQLAAGMHDDALKTAQAASASRKTGATYHALALVRAGRNEIGEALAALDEGLRARPNDAGLLAAKGRISWRLLRTASAVEALGTAARNPAAAGEARYWLGRIYTFKGWQAEGAFPGWHEEVGYRPRAIEAFRAAIQARPNWYAPRLALGDALLLDGNAADALAAFDAAIERGKHVGAARVGRWKALKTLNRAQEARREIDAAAKTTDPRLLGAAREGYVALGMQAEADALASRIVEQFPDTAPAEAVLAERIEIAGKAKQTAVVIDRARAFIQAHPYSRQLMDVYDSLIAAFAGTPSTPTDQITAAVEARVKLRPDPGAYFGGAGSLLARNAMLDRVAQLAEAGARAGELFIRENAASYKLDGKVQASRERNAAAAADLVGWVAFLQKDLAKAETKLAEAERLSHGLDMGNQFHLGELWRAKNNLETARDHYFNALTLTLGPPPLKDAAKKALADVYVRLGHDAADFGRYLAAELERKREERRGAMLQTMVGKPVPDLKLTDLKGQPVDLLSQRGNVVLLNFFASW